MYLLLEVRRPLKSASRKVEIMRKEQPPEETHSQ